MYVSWLRLRPFNRVLLVFIFVLLLSSCDSSDELPQLSNNAVILAFGDSLTRGKGAEDHQSYPTVLENLTTRKVINAGVSGELSEEGLKRLPSLLEQHSPDLLILCHGGNDILQRRDLNNMADNIREMIRLARERNIPVVLLGVPRPGLFLSSAEVYAEIADSTGVIYIEDLIPDILSNNDMKSDMAHPNQYGYEKIAKTILAILQEHGAI